YEHHSQACIANSRIGSFFSKYFNMYFS
ncbi:hypothetical protein CDAR_268501, partial [Caerostris darwini]